MKTVATIQSNYIPWRGYFDALGSVDEFIFLDEVQYTKRDWRNRNRVKTAHGVQWLTVPVQVKGRQSQRVDEVVVSDATWAEHHWMTLRHAYVSAAHFAAMEGPIRALYEAVAGEPRLSAINRQLIEGVSKLLGIESILSWSTDYRSSGTKTDRLVSLCECAGADVYLSGPRARAYLDEALTARGIAVRWLDYDGYPEYPQVHPPFDPFVSILDLLFNTGRAAPTFMKFRLAADPAP